MTDAFDLVVVGAGSGGVAASRRAAAHGAKVLIVEADRVGGTCVIRGCVPKKLMMYAASFGQAFEEARAYGWNGSSGSFEMHRWADAKASEIQRLEGIYRKMLADSGVELALGRARLLGGGEVAVGTRTVRAQRILIATGGAPARDALPGLSAAMTSNEVLDLREVPASLLVIGGGYIAVEFASILAGLGAKVTLAFRDTGPLRGFDSDLSQRTTHNALLDCKLLAEVYIELTGGRQRGLSLATAAAQAEITITHYVAEGPRTPRPLVPDADILAAHAAFVARLKDPLWLAE